MDLTTGKVLCGGRVLIPPFFGKEARVWGKRLGSSGAQFSGSEANSHPLSRVMDQGGLLPSPSQSPLAGVTRDGATLGWTWLLVAVCDFCLGCASQRLWTLLSCLGIELPQLTQFQAASFEVMGTWCLMEGLNGEGETQWLEAHGTSLEMPRIQHHAEWVWVLSKSY